MDEVTRDGLTLVALGGVRTHLEGPRLTATDDAGALARCASCPSPFGIPAACAGCDECKRLPLGSPHVTLAAMSLATTQITYPQPGQRVVVSEFGETPLDAIENHTALVPMPAPDPAALGPRDVIIAIRSASVGWVDLLMTSGQYQHMPKPPYCPGLEYAGVVAWVA